jgi:16S rRNA (guanine527-N7)-methyltransferase
MPAPDTLLQHVRASGLQLSPRAVEQLAAYCEALVEINRGVNLTAARDLGAVHEVLVDPSLVLAHVLPDGPAPARILDIGSGNGFPGVVAALRWPAAWVGLVERRGRKAEAIQEILERAGIINAEALSLDAREIPSQRPELVGAVDLITARAVGSLEMVNRVAAPLLAVGGRIVHWKAFALTPEELRRGDERAAARGLVRLPDIEFVPTPPGPGRLVRYERQGTSS